MIEQVRRKTMARINVQQKEQAFDGTQTVTIEGPCGACPRGRSAPEWARGEQGATVRRSRRGANGQRLGYRSTGHRCTAHIRKVNEMDPMSPSDAKRHKIPSTSKKAGRQKLANDHP